MGPMKLAIFLFILQLAVASGYAQDPEATKSSVKYSESSGYTPRRFAENKEKKRTNTKENRSSKKSLTDAPLDSETELLTFPLTVVDERGGLVTNLASHEVKLYIDGKNTDDFRLTTDTEPTNLVCLIDSSPSVNSSIKKIRNAMQTFVDLMSGEDRMLIATFSHKIKVRADLTGDRALLTKAVKKLNARGNGTSVYDTVHEFIRSRLNKLQGRTVVLIISDGVDTTSKRADYVSSLVDVEKGSFAIYPLYMDTYKDMHQIRTRTMSRTAAAVLSGVSRQGANLGLVGTSAREYQIGRMYINDLARASGGLAFQFEVVTKNPSSLKVFFNDFLKTKYWISISSDVLGSGKERHEIRVRIARPNQRVSARGSVIR